MKYKLIKPITLPKIDEDGYEIDNEFCTAPEDSEWVIKNNRDYEVYLENHLGDWLGMSKEKFKEYFKEVEKDV